ncbi:MAG TPA: head GIN domain-containing protein [Ignavibacteriaceae bacterium]|nr:head GIN domain-containing protein [Ignavibacteriaceae bacterium]
MKAALFIIAIISFLTTPLFFAQEVTKKYDFKDFSEVGVSHGMHVSVTQSDSYDIEVTAEQEDLDNLDVEKHGDALNFEVHKERYNFKGKVDIRIKMPSLAAINLSGGADGNIVMDVSSESFDAALSGGSELKGDLKCGNINLSLSGGSEITLKGKAEDTNMAGSGSSSFNLKEFSVRNVESQLSGGSKVTITMNGTLNTMQSGGSNLVYYGHADMENTMFSGGSEVEKGE